MLDDGQDGRCQPMTLPGDMFNAAHPRAHDRKLGGDIEGIDEDQQANDEKHPCAHLKSPAEQQQIGARRDLDLDLKVIRG
jgi:hypothetical protein